jgi:hypothetical protein
MAPTSFGTKRNTVLQITINASLWAHVISSWYYVTSLPWQQVLLAVLGRHLEWIS